jgi:hypothetical protein
MLYERLLKQFWCSGDALHRAGRVRHRGVRPEVTCRRGASGGGAAKGAQHPQAPAAAAAPRAALQYRHRSLLYTRHATHPAEARSGRYISNPLHAMRELQQGEM